MSKILITGNGFDLFHGLPTKYGHFMAVMKTIEKIEVKDKIVFSDLFDKDFGFDFSNDKSKMIKTYNVEDINFDIEKIYKLKEYLSNNIWYNHFKTVLELDTWIDFEMEIENVLNLLISLLKHINTTNTGSGMYKLNNSFYYRDIENFNIIELVNPKVFKINDEYFSIKTQLPDENKIFKKLANSLEEFIIIFNNYLINIVDVFYEKKIEKNEIPFSKIDEIYTFNYTSTLEKLYKVDNSKIDYLHGKSNIFDKNQNLVLGVSEVPELVKTNKMFEFTKYYQKVRKGTKHNFIKLPKAKTKTLDENIFYIIGHSLDYSDKEYVVKLFDFLELDTNKFSKICIFYFDEKDRSNKLKNLFSIIDKKIITQLDIEKRLYFVELTDSNIKFEFDNKIYNISSEYRIGAY